MGIYEWQLLGWRYKSRDRSKQACSVLLRASRPFIYFEGKNCRLLSLQLKGAWVLGHISHVKICNFLRNNIFQFGGRES